MVSTVMTRSSSILRACSKFVPKHVLASPDRPAWRAHGWCSAATVRAESRFAAPDAKHHMARDPKLALDFRERCLMLREQLAALCSEALELRRIEGTHRGLRELGLILAERPSLTGQDEIGQRQVGNDTTKGCIEGSAGHTGIAGLRPKCLDPGAKFFIRRGRRAMPRKPASHRASSSVVRERSTLRRGDICQARRRPAPSRVDAPSVGSGDRYDLCALLACFFSPFPAILRPSGLERFQDAAGQSFLPRQGVRGNAVEVGKLGGPAEP